MIKNMTRKPLELFLVGEKRTNDQEMHNLLT